ncbi:hypothetical protein [Bradyrhizobium sp. Leo121]|uniref:hypothetical protein n=1 Tax=Bradyrhizobium sp. Leo121 TaxID=1571195 RepID=UPI00102889AC|nr:hypothetical protein [Bradyrhizobium sp. Leo121]
MNAIDANSVGKEIGTLVLSDAQIGGEGHKVDVPVLTVDASGKATEVVPHLNVAEIRGRAIMIHAGGDNYSDQQCAWVVAVRTRPECAEQLDRYPCNTIH